MTSIEWFDTDASNRARILKATAVVLSRRGRLGLNLSDVATQAGVSRPTLYRVFASKQELLDALGRHEQQVVEDAVAAALEGKSGPDRLDALLRFIVEFQRSYPLRHLIEIEPAHELGELTRVLPEIRGWVRALIDERAQHDEGTGIADDADVLAGAVVRIALSHFLVPGDDDDQQLAQLRRAAGLTDDGEHRAR